eukprot:5014135-Pyramimonas_sp.AAC.2
MLRRRERATCARNRLGALLVSTCWPPRTHPAQCLRRCPALVPLRAMQVPHASQMITSSLIAHACYNA